MRNLQFLLALIFIFCPAIALARSDVAAPIAYPSFGVDGKLNFCALEHEYPDKTGLTLAMSPLGEINLGVTIPSAGFEKDKHYDLTLSLDSANKRKIRARALREETVLLQLGTDRAFAESLGSSRRLEIGGGSRTLKFSTEPLNNAVADLDQCIKDNKTKMLRQSSTAFPPVLKELLYRSGLTEVTPVSMDNIPPSERPADYVWKSGNIMGGIKEIQSTKDKNLSELIGLHINGLKYKCSGTFSANLEKETSSQYFKIRPATATCTTKQGDQESSVFVALLYSLSTRHLFTVFTNETSEAFKEEALTIRDTMARSLQEPAGN